MEITIEEATELVKKALVMSDLFEGMFDSIKPQTVNTRPGLILAFLEDQSLRNPKDVETACVQYIIKSLSTKIDAQIDNELLKQAKAEGKIA